ncbi:MAG: DNA repair protein RadA [Bacteroides sp.]|nr:MAG: DNA repair protein RadA [Bacteroides sp.]
MIGNKKNFFCEKCNYKSFKWLGKCPYCMAWNTFKAVNINNDHYKSSIEYYNINDIKYSENKRIVLHDMELNRVLGGGIVEGSISLIAGDPGIGKSTLIMQLCININKTILYISGEENIYQIKNRFVRLKDKNFLNQEIIVFADNNFENVIQIINKLMPNIIVVDSIQTLYYNDNLGSINQLKYIANVLMNMAKKNNIAIILIGHINKEGIIAGPKVLEHIVDVVLLFENSNNNFPYRIIKSLKNRFGKTSELAVYKMENKGLVPISNLSSIFLSKSNKEIVGNVVVIIQEGLQTILIGVESLVSNTRYNASQNFAIGYNYKRINMLIAVIEKFCKISVNSKDVYVNITGGINITDNSADLGIICSIISSYKNIPISRKLCLTGEISLSGEVKEVIDIDKYIVTAIKSGFKTIIVSSYNNIQSYYDDIEIILINNVSELINVLFI